MAVDILTSRINNLCGNFYMWCCLNCLCLITLKNNDMCMFLDYSFFTGSYVIDI